MRKWKQDYLLQKKQLQKNESGITLVELLAVLAIMSVIILLGGAIHMFGQTQFRAQSDSVSQNNDYSYAMTVMSTDLRRSSSSQITEARNNYIDIDNGSIIYEVGIDNVLYKNKVALAEKVGLMEVKKDPDSITVNLISSNSTAGVNSKNYQTTIYFRSEGETLSDAE